MQCSAWSAEPSLVWTHYEDSDDWIVFHPSSGSVYALNSIAHALWQLAAVIPASSSDFSVRLAAALSLSCDDAFQTAVQDTIDVMDEAGLLRPVQP